VPFDIDTVPKIKLSEASKDDIDLKKIGYYYYLYRLGRQEMCLNLQTNKEVKELYSSYDLGYGDILIGGLGFGILPLWLANKPGVTSIKVIEISQAVVDIFLERNNIPENFTIEIADIDKYVTDKHYDCIMVDHYELTLPEWRQRSMKKIAKNIPNHNLFWSWGIEETYLRLAYNTFEDKNQECFQSNQDFSEKWEHFRTTILDIPTVPALSISKINEYIYTSIDLLDSPYANISK
jgi:hypothetical protein